MSLRKTPPTEHQKNCPICMSKTKMPKEFWGDVLCHASLISPLSPFGHIIKVKSFTPEISLNVLGRRFRFKKVRDIDDHGGTLHSQYYFNNHECKERNCRKIEYELYSIDC